MRRAPIKPADSRDWVAGAAILVGGAGGMAILGEGEGIGVLIISAAGAGTGDATAPWGQVGGAGWTALIMMTLPLDLTEQSNEAFGISGSDRWPRLWSKMSRACRAWRPCFRLWMKLWGLMCCSLCSFHDLLEAPNPCWNCIRTRENRQPETCFVLPTGHSFQRLHCSVVPSHLHLQLWTDYRHEIQWVWMTREYRRRGSP